MGAKQVRMVMVMVALAQGMVVAAVAAVAED